MLKLSLEYIGLTFLANIGVLQLAARFNRLRGMSFFNNPVFTCLFALITIAPPLFVFFIWNNLLPTGIIEGAQQAGLFFISFLLSLVVTLGLTSFLRRSHTENTTHQQGIEIMRNTTYYKAIRDIADRKKL